MKHLDVDFSVVKVMWRDAMTGKCRWKKCKRYQPIPLEYGVRYELTYRTDLGLIVDSFRMGDSRLPD